MRPEQEQLLQQEALLIIYFVAILLFLAIFAIVFVVAFQRRKNKFLLERLEAEKKFEKELANSQLEIQEQTLKNIAWELHDNVGQLLSVANIQLNMLMNSAPEKFHQQIIETKEVVTASVTEIRSLSKILNTDVIKTNGLVTSLEVELERFNRLNFLVATFKVEGDEVSIKSQDEIIIFRILQEFFSNVMKHAKANNLFVHLSYKENALEILAKDDGVGYDASVHHGNSGMHTMKSRAELLQADFKIDSKIGEGTNLFLKYPYTHDKQS